MNRPPELDERYMTAEGCRRMADEFGVKGLKARMEMRRCLGWRTALLSRAENIEHPPMSQGGE